MSRLGIRTQPTGRAGRAGSTQFHSLVISTLFTLQSALQQIAGAFQKSGTIHSDFTDVVRRFWEMYQLQAQEYDAEFLAMHNGDSDISMIFAGLFCAVCATFIVFVQPKLNPDPDDVTHALLAALIITMNGTIPPGLPSPFPPSPPSSIIFWSQSLLYASLAIGLYAALGAVMGKQWLNHYDRVGIRGTIEDRGKERQRKLEALAKWHFHSILESLPFLLELSLFLFGVGLSAYLWDQQKTIGILYIAINAVGISLYVILTIAAAWYPDCPFQTPFSLRLRRSNLFLSLLWQTIFLPIIHQISSKVGQRFSTLHQQYRPIVRRWISKMPPILDTYFTQPICVAWKAVSILITATLRSVSSPLVRLARQRSHLDIESSRLELSVQAITAVQESGSDVSQPPSPRTVRVKLGDLFRSGWFHGGTKIKTFFKRKKIPSNAIASFLSTADPSRAASIVWILETCTDPSVEAVALEYMLSTDWPRNFDFCPLLDRFFLGFIECFEIRWDGSISVLLTSAAQEPERNATYGKMFLFLYWHARSIAPDGVMKWQCPMVGGEHRGMVYNPDRVPCDELTYLFLLISETIDSHPNPQRQILDRLAVMPGPSVLDNMSQTTAVALSRYWTYSLRHTPVEQDLWTCYKHVLAMSPYVPMTPAVLTHYSTVFAQAVGQVWKRGRLEESDFDVDAMLSRIHDIQEDMSSLATTPPHFFSLPHGRYISTFLLFLSYCAQSSWELRLRLREQNTALWCLNICQSVYAGVKNADFPASLSVWASCTLRLALIVMDNQASSNISVDPLSGSLRGEKSPLSSDHKQTLVPHLSWIMVYSDPERYVIFTESDTTGPLPIVVENPMMREFIISLQCIRFCVVIETLDRGFPVEAHSLLPKTYYIPNFPPYPLGPPNKLYNIMILSLKHQLRSLTQTIPSAKATNAQPLVVQWGGIYQLVLATAKLARDVIRDGTVEDILPMLGDLSQHVPDLLRGSSFEHKWGLDNLIEAYYLDHTIWIHKGNRSIARALARILLTSSGVHHLSQLDSNGFSEYEEDWDQMMALTIACAAWNPPLDLTERVDGEKRRVKISRAAVENTLVILANTSNHILEKRACCIRSVLEHPQRGEEEFDHPPGDKVGRHRVDEVYRQFRHRLEAMGGLDNVPTPSIPIPGPTRTDNAAAAPISPTAPSGSGLALPAPPDPTTGDDPAVTNIIPSENGRGSPPIDQVPSSSLGVVERAVPGPSGFPEEPQATVTEVSQSGVDWGTASSKLVGTPSC